MNRADLISTYENFLNAFDLTPNEVVVDKSCMDVLMGRTETVPKLSLLLHPMVHRFAVEIIEHEALNMSPMWGFLSYLDLHMLFDPPKTISVGGIIGSAESFIGGSTTRTLH